MNNFVEEYLKAPIEWSLFILFLLGLFYGAKKIKVEKDAYLKSAIPMKLGPINLLIPPWWCLTKESSNCFYFERTDTHYDWHAEFKLITSKKDILSLGKAELKNNQIELDPGEDQTLTDSSLRLEGMGTQKETERIYLDLFVKKLDNGSFLVAKSLSSVLNGSVEGPYFDEVINRIYTHPS